MIKNLKFKTRFLINNVKVWFKAFLTMAGTLYSCLSVVLSIQSWTEFGVNTIAPKIIVYLIGLAIAAVLAVIYVDLKRSRNHLGVRHRKY